MTFTYNDVTYTVTEDSIYRDFSIEVNTLEEGCAVINALEGMTDYTFSKVDYSGMMVTKRSIIVTGNIYVNVKLRNRSKREVMEDELNTLKNSMSELALNTNKTTATKINKLLSKGVSE